MLNRNNISKIASLFIAVGSMALWGCGGGKGSLMSEYELFPDPRPGWDQYIPYGMVVCPSGTFHMGQADEDVPSSRIAQNKQVTIGGFFMDDTEITNNEYRFFCNKYLAAIVSHDMEILAKDDSMMTEDEFREGFLPDTMVWVRDFAHHMGDPMMEYYFFHPAFDDYPVVGVDWFAAKKFCEWRTNHLNKWRFHQGLPIMPRFRLPSEAEWEYAARGARDMAKYPWGNPYIRNTKGCMLANFKPGRGNYYDDGFMYTAPVASYFSNDFGLYDMAGNVSEWCEDAFNEVSVPTVWDLNPTYIDDKETRKVIRGGSWKDVAYYLETGSRDYEYRDQSKSYVGFRCVMTYLGRSSGYEF